MFSFLSLNIIYAEEESTQSIASEKLISSNCDCDPSTSASDCGYCISGEWGAMMPVIDEEGNTMACDCDPLSSLQNCSYCSPIINFQCTCDDSSQSTYCGDKMCNCGLNGRELRNIETGEINKCKPNEMMFTRVEQCLDENKKPISCQYSDNYTDVFTFTVKHDFCVNCDCTGNSSDLPKCPTCEGEDNPKFKQLCNNNILILNDECINNISDPKCELCVIDRKNNTEIGCWHSSEKELKKTKGIGNLNAN
jgi:hypothetical protein